MKQAELKSYYTSVEIANMRLKTAPSGAVNVLLKAKREGWRYRKRVGRGGGVEYEFASLPQEIQKEIVLKVSQAQAQASHCLQGGAQSGAVAQASTPSATQKGAGAQSAESHYGLGSGV